MSSPTPSYLLQESTSSLLRWCSAESRLAVLTLIRDARKRVLTSEHWKRVMGLLKNVSVESEIPLADAALRELIQVLIPWRTGPIPLPGVTVDAEWVSTRKWKRIAPLLPELSGKSIADVGCSNGYFTFNLVGACGTTSTADQPKGYSLGAPSFVLGVDPVDRCWLQFALTRYFFKAHATAFLPAGLDSLSLFPRRFDLILCMGVIYHQRDPFTALKTLYEALAPGGTLILESLVIPTSESVLLVPKERYAKMRNAWQVPSPEALRSLMTRAGFSSVRVEEFGRLSTEEQRRTEFAPYESLADFLDPLDPMKTVEGYPAPHTAAVLGVREG